MKRPGRHYPFRVGWTALLLLSLALFQFHCGGRSSSSVGADGNISQDGQSGGDADATTVGEDQTLSDSVTQDTTNQDSAGLDQKAGEDAPAPPAPGRMRLTSGSNVMGKNGITIRGDVVWTSAPTSKSKSTNGSIVIIHSIEGP